MRVLLLSELSSVHTHRWAVGLSGEGVQVGVFSLEASTAHDYASHGVSTYVVGLSLGGRRSLRGRLGYLKAWPALRRAVRAFRPDVVHAHYATHHGLLGAVLGFRPYFLSVWGSDVYDFPRRSRLGALALRYCFRRATRLLSTSRAMAREAGRYTGRSFAVVPFGVDTARFRPLPSVEVDGGLFGCVKALEYRYGIDVLLHAFAQVAGRHAEQDLRLEIVGEGGARGELEALAASLGVADRVAFLGYVPQSDLPGRYGRYLTCVLPSREESFGVVALESMACGCPVIASDAEGFCETVRDGVTGVLVARGDAEQLVAAMVRMLNDRAARDRMGVAGRAWVEEHYEWRENVRSVVGLYREYVAG